MYENRSFIAYPNPGYGYSRLYSIQLGSNLWVNNFFCTAAAGPEIRKSEIRNRKSERNPKSPKSEIKSEIGNPGNRINKEIRN